MRNLLFFVAVVTGLVCGHVRAQQHDIRQFNFSASDSVAAKYYGHSLQNLPVLAHKLTSDLPNETQKFRAIYKWVCDNIANDYQLFTDNQRNRGKLNPEELKQWNAKVRARMFETLVKKRATVCTGYAFLIKELSQFAGITAEIVDGYGRTISANIGGEGAINHSWTAVLLEGKWYLCDATWASGAIDFTHKVFVKRYEDAYFLSDPEYFIRNHYPLGQRWSLLSETPSLSSFLNRPIIYSAAYKHKILTHTPDRFEIGSNKMLLLRVKYKSGQNLPISIAVNNGLPQPATVTEESPGIYRIEYLFERAPKGPVHVLVNGDVVLTYKLIKETTNK